MTGDPFAELFKYPPMRETRYGYVTDEEYEKRAAAGRAKQQERMDCPLCDPVGYRRGWLCNHRPCTAREEALVRETERARQRQHLTVVDTEPDFPRKLSPTDSSGWRVTTSETLWFVYTMFTDDVAKHPVYVGFTGDVHRRLSQHRAKKAWWPLVHSIVVDAFTTREEALEAEEQSIRKTKPLFNVVSNQHTVEAP